MIPARLGNVRAGRELKSSSVPIPHFTNGSTQMEGGDVLFPEMAQLRTGVVGGATPVF